MDNDLEALASAVRSGQGSELGAVNLAKSAIRAAASQGTPFRQHPLGFLRLRLSTFADRSQLLLHCWPEHQRAAQSSELLMHAHRFDVHSWLLQGELLDEQLRWVARPGGTYRLYGTRTTEASSRLLPRSEVGDLVTASRITYSAGQCYTIPVGVFHRTSVPKTVRTVTIAYLGPPVAPTSLVAGPAQGRSPDSYDRDAVSPSRSEQVLQDLLEAL